MTRCVAVAMLTLVAFASGRASQPALARIANQDPDALLDRVETVVGKAVQLAKQNEIVFAATGGLALMTCSRHFTYSLLFLQSFKAAGWPIVRDGACELGESYRSARAAFKEELPELRKARALVPKLKEDVQQARALLESASSQTSALTKQAAAAEAKLNKWTSAVAKASAAGGGGGGVPRDAGELQAKLQAAKKAKAEAESALASATKTQQACIAKYAELRSRYAELSRVQNSVQAVSDALDPAKLERVAGGMAAGALSCVASATSPLASSALLGSSFGSLVSERALPLVRAARERIADGPRLPPDVAARVPTGVTKWLDTATRSACAAASCWFAYRARALSLTCSGALLGARLFTSALSSGVDSCCGRRLSDFAVDATGLYRRLDALDGTVDGTMGSGTPVSVSISALPLNAEAGLELALTAWAIAAQVGSGASAGVPIFAKVFLSPLLAFEAYLKALAAGKMLAK